MWINLSKDQLQLIHAALGRVSVPEARQAREEIDRAVKASFDPANAAWVEKAKELHQDEGSVEVDEQGDDSALVSFSDEGAYVMAWVWVGNADMGIEDDEKEDPDGAEE